MLALGSARRNPPLLLTFPGATALSAASLAGRLQPLPETETSASGQLDPRRRSGAECRGHDAGGHLARDRICQPHACPGMRPRGTRGSGKLPTNALRSSACTAPTGSSACRHRRFIPHAHRMQPRHPSPQRDPPRVHERRTPLTPDELLQHGQRIVPSPALPTVHLKAEDPQRRATVVGSGLSGRWPSARITTTSSVAPAIAVRRPLVS